ncbi:MAG: hypothetical protein K9K76_10530 [Halanaerobiales bacterium]|nr:hypothetical protein [Halanaerobiales bacterium]
MKLQINFLTPFFNSDYTCSGRKGLKNIADNKGAFLFFFLVATLLQENAIVSRIVVEKEGNFNDQNRVN